MATGTTSVGHLQGIFKEVYSDKIENLIPDHAIIQKEIPFNEREMTGNAYHMPVRLSGSQGVSYAAPDAGAFALNPAVALNTRDAVLKGNQMVVRDNLAYDAVAKSEHGGKKAFVEATRYVIDSLMDTAATRLEICLIYGGVGLGNVNTSANTNATTTVLSFSAPEWAVGLWSGQENALLNFYISDTTLVGAGADSVFSIATMDVDARTITMVGTAVGITALDVAIAANAGDVNIYYLGAKGNEAIGIDGIITNTSTLFNIDAGVFNLWRGNVVDNGGTALTLQKVYNAISRAVGRGLKEDVTMYVSPPTWSNLAADQAAQRQFDTSYKGTAEAGHNEIMYYAANGYIKIVSHAMVKEGEAFLVPLKRMKRIGASPIRFKPYGTSGNETFFKELEDQAGFQVRCYSNQALLGECPAKMIKIFGIVNT